MRRVIGAVPDFGPPDFGPPDFGPPDFDPPDFGTEQVPAELLAAVVDAKGSDPLAPVTVVSASGYAAVFVRRALALGTHPSRRRGIANVNATTLSALVRALALPVLAARDLRPVSRAIDLEALRTEALAAGGWLGRFAAHPRSLGALEMTLRELRRCPPAVLESVGSTRAQTAALVTLLEAVRRRLHSNGFADDMDVARAALEAVRAESTICDLGPSLTWDLGRCPHPEAEVLQHLRARAIDDPTARGRPPATFSEVRPCGDADEEARAAVRTVLDGTSNGVALWRQAMFHPPGAGYSRLLHQHLSAAGIAANGPGLRRLDRSASARALLGLLEIAGGDWDRAQVTAWFASAPVAAGVRRRGVPASRWDALSAAAGVIRGAEQWRERLSHHAAHHEADAAEAEALSDFVSGLVSRTAAPARSWAERARWAAGLLDQYVEPGASEDPWPDEEVAASAQVHGVVESLGDLDKVSPGTDLASFRSALQSLLAQTELKATEPGCGGFGDGVFVAPFAISRGLRFEQVIACGLADPIVPGSGGIDPLLDEDTRLSDASGTLRSRVTRQRELHDDLVCAVRTGTGHRVGLLPRCDPRTGRSLFASRWLGELAPSGTSLRPVDSFAAGIAGEGPALSDQDFAVRTLDRWVSCGGEVSKSPLARADRRFAAGVEAITARAGRSFTRFDGAVGVGMVSPFDPDSPVSATRFETYAHCPRRYMLERALRVSKRVLPEELWRIEPIERGSLLHAILESYVAERLAGAPRSIERLLAIAEERLDQAEAGGLVGKRLLWRMDRANICRDLRRFHDEEGDLRPLSVELAFGGEDADASPPVTITLDDGREIGFRGSVDRVDVTPSGRLVVSDYKTGKQAGLGALLRDPVASGTRLQLPLYALAARARFGTADAGPVHARYWLVSSERSAPCYHLVVTEDVEDRFRHVIGLIAKGVEAGAFPGVPGPAIYDGRFENCRTCDFDKLCPAARERQWNRKLEDPSLRAVTGLLDDDIPGSLAGAVVRGFVDPDADVVR